MHTIGFTATRRLTSSGESMLRYHLTRLPSAQRYRTGGCRGGDAFIGRFLAWKWPQAEHEIIIPANRSQVDRWWETGLRGDTKIRLVEMPEGTTYKDRNLVIVGGDKTLGVAESDALAGFPAYPEADRRSTRSGSWQTIRMGRKAEKPVVWHSLCPPCAGDDSELDGWRWPA